VNVLPGSCSGTCVSPCDDACEVISIKAEPGTGIEIKVEENPEPISFAQIKAEPDTATEIKVEENPEPVSFPEIKAEPNEVSYMFFCHQYTKIARLFCGFFYLGLPTQKTLVWGMEISVSYWIIEFLVRECVCK